MEISFVIVFVSIEPVKENLKSRSFRPFLYLKDTTEVGLICPLNSYLIEIQISADNFMYTSVSPKFKCILGLKI